MNHLESLQRLADLFQKGVLTKEEFESEKAYLLTKARELHVQEPRGLRGHLSTTRARVAIGVIFALVAGVAVAVLTINEVQPQDAVENPPSTSQLSRPNSASASGIGFANVKGCEPDDEFKGLLGRIREAAASKVPMNRLIYVSGTTQPVEVKSSTYGDKRKVTIAAIPVKAAWHGVDVTEIRALDWPKGSGFQIISEQSTEQLSRELSQQGLRIRSKEIQRGDGWAALVEPFNQGSSWTCVWSTEFLEDDSTEEAPNSE